MKTRIIGSTPVWIILFLAFVCSQPLHAQSRYNLVANPTLKIDGSSNARNWSMTSTTATGNGQFTLQGGELAGIQNLTVELQAESLKSGTNGLDKKAYGALDTKNNKTIRFTLRDLTGSGATRQARGDLQLAGTSRPISFSVTVGKSGNNFTFEGSIPIKLTDFGIDPPTAVMGTIRTRDDATISFNATFQPAN